MCCADPGLPLGSLGDRILPHFSQRQLSFCVGSWVVPAGGVVGFCYGDSQLCRSPKSTFDVLTVGFPPNNTALEHPILIPPKTSLKQPCTQQAFLNNYSSSYGTSESHEITLSQHRKIFDGVGTLSAVLRRLCDTRKAAVVCFRASSAP